MRSAVFHVEWPVSMQAQSLGIQTGSNSERENRAGERVRKCGQEREMEGGKRRED